jgi:hypothetical protein
MRHYTIINGTKWYYRLKEKEVSGSIQRGLFNDNPRNTLTKSLIIGHTTNSSDVNKKEIRLYTVFKSYLEYGIYQMKLPQHERCFYEIILGESAQKPHFDIDMGKTEIDGSLVINNLVDCIIDVLREKGITIEVDKDIMLFTSHGAGKQSYHIIVDNYCHANNIEARAFYDQVTDKMNPSYKNWIDQAVYSPTQQFRIVGSQKTGTTRVKTLSKTWSYNGVIIEHKYPEKPDSPEHEFVMQLESSIIGFTGNCKYLPPFEPHPDRIKNYADSEDLSKEDALDAIKLVAAAGKITIEDSRFPYKIIGINGPIVMLKRTKPSRCRICQRVHQNENPYLLVVGDEKNVYFHCRRSPENKKLFLGKLNPVLDEKDPAKISETETEETKQIEKIKINWTNNIIDRVKRVAEDNKTKKKTTITELNDQDKKLLIDMFINSK